MRSLRILALGLCGVAAVVACSDDEDPVTPGGGAGLDASFGGDVTAPVADAEVPPGDVCGNRSGLQPGSPWPVVGGCPTRAGRSTLAGPRSAAVTRALALPVSGAPVISADGVVWFGTTDGDVVATLEGSIRAVLHTGAPVLASAALDAEGTAIIGGGDGTLYGLALPDRVGPDGGIEDGGADAGDAGDAGTPAARIVFSRVVGSTRGSPVIAEDGTIYVAIPGQLLALAPRAASVRWTRPTGDTRGSSPAIGQDGTVYVGSTDHRLHAFAPDGAEQWALDVGSEIGGSPAVGGDGVVYVGTDDGKLHAIASGAERWAYTAGGAITSTPAVYAGTVHVGSADRKIHAVSTIDGSLRWAYETQGSVASPVIGSDGVVYVGATDARVYALTPTGGLFFAVNVRGKVTSAPAFGGGQRLWVTTENGLAILGP